MARRGSTQAVRLVLLLVIAVAGWLYKEYGQGWKILEGEKNSPWSETKAPGGASPSSPKAPERTGAYETYRGCVFEEHRQNDGDSFRVRLPDGRVEQFRLYYVDCPESDFRTYQGGADNHERIHEQALAFGVSDAQAVEIGKRAKELVHGILSRVSFTLYTRWDDPFGDKRFHAFIRPAEGPWLHETLVREGLARIHTKPAELPDGTPSRTGQAQLRELEREAKKAKRGAWGMH